MRSSPSGRCARSPPPGTGSQASSAGSSRACSESKGRPLEATTEQAGIRAGETLDRAAVDRDLVRQHPTPARAVPLMVGTHGPRMLEATVQHVQTWYTCYAWYGNSVDGFAALSATVEADVRRSTCVLVTVDGGGGERALEQTAPPVEAERLAAHLAAL